VPDLFFFLFKAKSRSKAYPVRLTFLLSLGGARSLRRSRDAILPPFLGTEMTKTRQAWEVACRPSFLLIEGFCVRGVALFPFFSLHTKKLLSNAGAAHPLFPPLLLSALPSLPPFLFSPIAKDMIAGRRPHVEGRGFPPCAISGLPPLRFFSLFESKYRRKKAHTRLRGSSACLPFLPPQLRVMVQREDATQNSAGRAGELHASPPPLF